MSASPTLSTLPNASPQPFAAHSEWSAWRALRTLVALLGQYSLGEMRQHPWRTLTATLTIALGVALALAVHLINASALAEFSRASDTAQRSAQSAANGEPIWWLRSSTAAPIDHATFEQLRAQPDIALLLPVVQANLAVRHNEADTPLTMQLRGVDALAQAQLGLTWVARAGAANTHSSDGGSANRLDVFAPDAVFINSQAATQLAQLTPRNAVQQPGQAMPSTVQVQVNNAWVTLRVAGTVSGGLAPTLVMDVASAQALLGLGDGLTRIGINTYNADGTDGTDDGINTLSKRWGLGNSVYLQAPAQEASRLANMTRAYRVNLSVLALVALFTGAFLVFSVLALSVAKRLPQFALLGVLGFAPRMRMALVLAEAGVLGLVGSVLGVLLAVGLATLALQLLNGDLGSGLLASRAPSLQLWANAWAIVGFMALGIGATLVGAWWPARSVAQVAPAIAIKGLFVAKAHNATQQLAWGIALLVLSAIAISLPPLWDMPLGAYVGIAMLLLGTMVCLPVVVGGLLRTLPSALYQRMLPMLALTRAQRVPYAGTVAISGVVTSLALAVALTVMVASFRGSVTQWLDTILPADIYLRSSPPTSNIDRGAFNPQLLDALRDLPDVALALEQHVSTVTLDANQAPVAVMARRLTLAADGWPQDLPAAPNATPTAPPELAPGGRDNAAYYPVWISEALRDTYQLRVGQPFDLLNARIGKDPNAPGAQRAYVAGVWRDYARQTGSVVMQWQDLQHTHLPRDITDIAVTLTRGATSGSLSEVQQAIRQAYSDTHNNAPASELTMATTTEIRTQSLRIFDRSFAVTQWLQMVAIGIGLFGVATSVSAQVLARQREFGLLAHLGLTPAQVQRLVTGEALLWSVVAAAVGLGLGLLVSAVLVFVVNPQSFHWTMDWQLPLWR
jgi:putative ABC transport system permease protein